MTKMPDPVVFRLDKDGNRSEGMITTTQAEAYADERVREVLQKALGIISDSLDGESNPFIEIRKLIPKEQS